MLRQLRMASLRQASYHGSQSQSDHNPFNGTGQNEPDVESADERRGRAYTSVLDPPCSERTRIIAESCDG
jgi:hypothetical protein